MAGFTQIAIAPGTTIDGVLSIASQSLCNQGYEVRYKFSVLQLQSFL